MAEGSNIHIIGLGVTDCARLSSEAAAALERADWVLGSERQLKVVEGSLHRQSVRSLPALNELQHWISKQIQLGRGRIVVLASGDPLYYGIGSWFTRHFSRSELTFHPATSSLQAACHALGLSLQEVEVVSLHGRAPQRLRTKLKRNARLLILTDQYSAPSALARECISTGFALSTITIFERLGYPQECIRTFGVEELAQSSEDFDPLHLALIEVRGSGGVLPEFPGIPDDHFIVDASASSPHKQNSHGMVTKRPVRLLILSWLQPGVGDVIWDVGSGSGSVAVELAYWASACQVYAIEKTESRLNCLRDNRTKFGVVDNLHIVPGRAPEALMDLPPPNKIFLGGTDGEMPTLLRDLWLKLPEGGMIVVSAITEPSKHHVLNFVAGQSNDLRLDTVELTVGQGDYLAQKLIYRPHLPVTIFKLAKETIRQ